MYILVDFFSFFFLQQGGSLLAWASSSVPGDGLDVVGHLVSVWLVSTPTPTPTPNPYLSWSDIFFGGWEGVRRRETNIRLAHAWQV
jgi:hypothetical protein